MEMERNTVKCDLCRDLPGVCGQTADQSEQPLALNVDDQSADQMKLKRESSQEKLVEAPPELTTAATTTAFTRLIIHA